MTRVDVTERAVGDLERLVDVIAAEHPHSRAQAASERTPGVRIVGRSSSIGREREEGRRELILSRGRYDYVAKCRWLPAEAVVLILPVRHQLEAGYTQE